MKKAILTLSLGTILFAFCTSCQKEDVPAQPEIQVVDPESTPTEDVIGYSTNAKVLILGETDDMLGKCFPKRLLNASTTASKDENYELVVVNKLESATGNAQAVSSCVKTFINGGAIIIFNSSYSDYVKFHEALMGAQGDEMIYDTPVRNIPGILYTISDMVKNTLASSESDIMPAVVMKATGVGYVFPSPKTVVISQYDCAIEEQTGEQSEPGTVEEEKEIELCDPTPYSYGKLCEDILEWAEIDEATPNGQLEDITNAGIDIPIWRHFCYNTKGTSIDIDITRDIRFWENYRVWSVYDTRNKRDLYLVHSSITFEGSRLKCGPSNEYQWWGGSKIVSGYYGPYLYEIESTARMDGVEPVMTDISPSGDMGSSKYTCGFNWSISGGVTTGSSPGLNFGGSLGFSKSWDTQVPHLKMQFRMNNNKPEYKYTAGILPTSHFSMWAWTNAWHDAAKEDLRRDIILNQKWIWAIPSNPGNVFYMSGKLGAGIQMLGYNKKFFATKATYYNLYYHSNNPFKIALPAPPRVDQRWRENCTPASDKLNNFLSLKYKNLFFHDIFHVPASTEQDMTKIDALINDLTRNILPHDKQIWKDNGLTGTYTFTWKRAESDKNYKTFTYVVE